MGDIYNPETFVVNKSVFRLINRVKNEALSALDQALAADPEVSALEVTAAQYVIIAQLAEREANSSAQLCKSFSYDAGAMTRMVDRLEAKGLVERRRCPGDRRLINLELTEAGKALFPKMKAISATVQNRFLRGFSKVEVRQLEEFLGRILQNA
ncbi:MAG TPA: MarR family transcriptional regulator [Burkholderiaceae bacterium]|jgi:DNA-binding MarR family transcriptional regulator|nr:MarR family transcriptional regulator [Burkholderiaceae bacterium]